MHRTFLRRAPRASRRLLATSFAGLLGIAVLAATGALPAGASSTTTQPVNLSGVTLNVADQLKEYQTAFQAAGVANTPYKISWSNFIGGPPIIAAESGGSVDLGSMAETPTIFAQSAGDPVKVVSVSEGLNPATSSPYAIVVPQNSPIKTLAQLKGHSIAVQLGTVEQYVLVRLLQKAGLSYNSVTIDNLPITTGETALESGSVDAYVTSYPFVSLIEQAGKGKVLATGAGVTLFLGYLTASTAALENPGKAAAIADFVVRFHKAQTYLQDHPALAAQTYATEYGVPLSVAQDTVKHSATTAKPINASVIAYQQAEANTLNKLDLIPEKLNVVNIFDTRLNSAVEAYLKSAG